jgi:hypothetical protein
MPFVFFLMTLLIISAIFIGTGYFTVIVWIPFLSCVNLFLLNYYLSSLSKDFLIIVNGLLMLLETDFLMLTINYGCNKIIAILRTRV